MKSNHEWELLARSDPLYAISSERGRRRNQRGWDDEAFFAKGRVYLDLVAPGLTGVSPDATILDLGSGAGRLSTALASQYREVVGVDVAPSMVDLARQMCSHVPNVEFRLSDGIELPVPSSSVDAVVSIQVLQHVDPKALPLIVAECVRVTRPGGKLLLHLPRPWIRSALRRALTLVELRRLGTRLAFCIKPDLDFARRGWVISQYHTYRPRNVLPMLLRAGLTSPESFEFRRGAPHSTVWVATVP